MELTKSIEGDDNTIFKKINLSITNIISYIRISTEALKYRVIMMIGTGVGTNLLKIGSIISDLIINDNKCLKPTAMNKNPILTLG